MTPDQRSDDVKARQWTARLVKVVVPTMEGKDRVVTDRVWWVTAAVAARDGLTIQPS